VGALWNGLIQFLIESLTSLQGIVGSYGLAIIVFTVLVRVATYPLNQKQLESSKAMQDLQPKLKDLQNKYANDKEKLTQETMQLYRDHGVNPMAGCLPMVIQMPIWIGLYRALLNMAKDGLLHEGFLWVPSLAEPNGMSWITSRASWVFPDTGLYLILPILTLVTQVIVQRMTTPTPGGGGDDAQQAMMNQMMNFMPLMFGFFALQVPSGLTLYWATSNILQIVQQGGTSGWGDMLPTRLARPALSNPIRKPAKIEAPPELEPKGTDDARRRKRRKKRRN